MDMEYLVLNNKLKDIKNTTNSIETTTNTINNNASTAATKATAAATDAASIKTTVDTIDTKIDTINVNAETAATKATSIKSVVDQIGNRTKSSGTEANISGTLSEKLSYIIEQNNNSSNQVSYLTPSTTNVAAIVLDSEVVIGPSQSSDVVIGKPFYFDGAGECNVSITLKVGSTSVTSYEIDAHIVGYDGTTTTTSLFENSDRSTSYHTVVKGTSTSSKLKIKKGSLLYFTAVASHSSYSMSIKNISLLADAHVGVRF